MALNSNYFFNPVLFSLDIIFVIGLLFYFIANSFKVMGNCNKHGSPDFDY